MELKHWGKLGFDGMEPEATGRPAYHPATLLKIYVYGYLNRIHSSRRLERAQDHKLPAHPADGLAIVLAEIRDRLEIVTHAEL